MSWLTRVWRSLLGSRVDPRTPHAYQPIWSSQRGLLGPAASVLSATTDASRGRCRLPGCSKPPDDPIHQQP